MTIKTKILGTLAALTLFCTLLGMPANAQEEEAEPTTNDIEVSESEAESQDWEVYIEPIIWLPSTNTDFTFGQGTRGGDDGSDVSRGTSATDALSKLHAAAMGRVGANNGKWGVVGELYYASLSNTTQRRFFATDARLKGLIYQLAGTYRLADKERFDFDAVFGLRGYSLDLEADVSSRRNLLGGLSASATTSNVDPIIGGQATWELGKSTDLIVYGDVGGFGLGSDFTWRASAAADIDLSKSVSLELGYQAMNFSDERGSGLTKLDLSTTLHGPLVGFKFRL
jgi:hypothetical protein